jgi:Histidine kinase-, DNA gyrase B-, and HSP90-like ATPase
MNREPVLIPPLPQSLSSQETWGFGFSGLLLWLGTAPAMNAALGPQAIWVWLPGTIISMMLNLQVKRLGTYFPEVAGGTPNYTTRLLHRWPNLARYGAIGYMFGWASVPAMNAIVLTDLIKANLTPLGITCPEILLRIGFTVLPFIVALSGTRTLGILHSCFVFPAIGFLLTFCFQGMAWLSFAPISPNDCFGGGWVGMELAGLKIVLSLQIQQRIFDPFFTTKPVGKGTGMGMSISYQIITEKHGGKLKCFSAIGQGTEFIIQIPIRQQVCKAV